MNKTTSKSVESVENDGGTTALWTWRSVRLQMAFLLSLALTIHGISRASLGMALVCMVRQKAPPSGVNASAALVHAPEHNMDLQVDWNAQEISLIHTSVYVGTVLSVFFSHTISQRIGAKTAITLAIATNTLVTWSTPLAIYVWPSAWIMVGLRISTGLAQGMVVPCASLLIAKWFAESEKSTAMAIFTTGNQVGISTAMFATAEFCKVPFLGGWPTSFIVYGFYGVLFLLLWIPLASSRPRQSKRISTTELMHIDGVGNRHRAASTITRTPYRKLIFSPTILSLCACSFCQTYVLVVMISYLPEFYRAALGLNLSANGLWSSLPFAIQMLSKILFAFTADSMKKRGFGVNFVTKLFNNIACFGCAACLLAVSVSDTPALLIGFLCLGLALTSGYVPGYNTSVVCVAPNYTAFVSAYSQGFAIAAGIISPIVTGFLITEANIQAWSSVFQMLVVLLVLSGFGFQLFGSADVQPWAVTSSLAAPIHSIRIGGEKGGGSDQQSADARRHDPADAPLLLNDDDNAEGGASRTTAPAPAATEGATGAPKKRVRHVSIMVEDAVHTADLENAVKE